MGPPDRSTVGVRARCNCWSSVPSTGLSGPLTVRSRSAAAPIDEFRPRWESCESMTHPSPLAIEASGLAKSFGEVRAVDGVDLAVRSGSVYGVLGPNGAGKTTTIRMLATLIRPDAGSARV